MGDVDIDREYGNLAFNELSPLGTDTLGTGHSVSRASAEQAVPSSSGEVLTIPRLSSGPLKNNPPQFDVKLLL